MSHINILIAISVCVVIVGFILSILSGTKDAPRQYLWPGVFTCIAGIVTTMILYKVKDALSNPYQPIKNN